MRELTQFTGGAVEKGQIEIADHIFTFKTEEFVRFRRGLRTRTGGAFADVRGRRPAGGNDGRYHILKHKTELWGRYTFNLRLNALNDPTSKYGKLHEKFNLFTQRRVGYFLLRLIHSKLPKWINYTVIDQETVNFYSDLLRKAVDQNRIDQTQPLSFLKLALEIQDEEKRNCIPNGW